MVQVMGFPIRRPAITSINANLLSTGLLGTTFRDILMNCTCLLIRKCTWNVFCKMLAILLRSSFVFLHTKMYTRLLTIKYVFDLNHCMLSKNSTILSFKFSSRMQLLCLYYCGYRKTFNISRTLVGNKIVDNSDVVGASPVGAAPTTSSFST